MIKDNSALHIMPSQQILTSPNPWLYLVKAKIYIYYILYIHYIFQHNADIVDIKIIKYLNSNVRDLHFLLHL